MPQTAIRQLAIGPMMNFSYLIGDERTKSCAVVDPGWDAAQIAKAAEGEGWKVEKILLTHAHFDHANALADLVLLTKATVCVHKSEAGSLPPGIDLLPTDDGTVIQVGDLKICCMHTPGHTPGSQCFLLDNAVFTGDTLFVDGCGRVDLPESDPRKMLLSLKKLAGLAPSTTIYPGHDYGPTPISTIGQQLKSNPYLSATSETMLI